MIVGDSDGRVKKNAYDREQGIEKLRKRYPKGIPTKADINRGYKKFLRISLGVTGSMDEAKIVEDRVWDYKTNTKLGAEQVYEEYRNLWNVEWSFRITKEHLK